jgi:hypothetical protein
MRGFIGRLLDEFGGNRCRRKRIDRKILVAAGSLPKDFLSAITPALTAQPLMPALPFLGADRRQDDDACGVVLASMRSSPHSRGSAQIISFWPGSRNWRPAMRRVSQIALVRSINRLC